MASPQSPSVGYRSTNLCMPRFPLSPASLARIARVRLGDQPLTAFRLVSRDGGKGRCSLCVQYYADDAPADRCPRCSRTVCTGCIEKCAVCTERICGFCRSTSVNLGCAPGREDQEDAMRFRVCNACVKRFAIVEDYYSPDDAWRRTQTGRFAHLHVMPAPTRYLVLGPLVVESGENSIAPPNLTLVNLGLGGDEQVRRDSGACSQAASRAEGSTPRSASSGHTGCRLAPALTAPALNPAPASITVPSRKSPSRLGDSSQGAVDVDSDTASRITIDDQASVTVSLTNTGALSSRSSSFASKDSANDELESAGYPSRAYGGGQGLRGMWAAMSVGESPGIDWASSPPMPAAFAYPAYPAAPTPPPAATPSHRTPPSTPDMEAAVGGDDAHAEMRTEEVGVRGDKTGDGEAVEGKEEPPQGRWGVGYRHRLACGGVALAVGLAVWAVTGRPPRR